MNKTDTRADDAGSAASLAAARARAEGLYVTVEGIDGSGKTSLVRRLAGVFDEAVVTQEPVEGTWHGDAVREALRSDTGPFTDAFLFMADRAEHLHSRVEPALADGRMVISDRSADSTYAYQAGRVEAIEPFEWFDACYAPWDIEPDLTLWLDVPPEVAAERADGEEKYEELDKLREVADNYEQLSMRHSHRYHRIDATQSERKVVEEAVEAVLGVAE